MLTPEDARLLLDAGYTMADAFRSLQLQQYHQLFLSKKERADGRNLLQFRDVDVTMSLVKTADGSCCVRFGNSSVICGTKLMIQAPHPDQPNEGILDVIVKLPPNALYKYKWNKDAYADEEQVMASQIRSILLSSECLDLEQLVIQQGKDVWELNLEVICLDFDGNIMDVALTAAVGCLMSTTVPEVIAGQESGDNYKFTDQKNPLKLKSIPISSSFAIMSRDVTIADASVEEEILSNGIVNIVINHPNKSIVRLHKETGLSMSQESMFDLVTQSEQRADSVAEALRKSLQATK